MKKIFGFLFFFIILFITIYIFRDPISNYLYEKYILGSIEISTLSPNEYYLEKNYNYVQITNDFEAKDYQHLLNIYYTIINSGSDEFTFMCSREYDNCLKDVNSISNDQEILSNINSFVHTFNSFSSVETEYDSIGRVTIVVNKLYSDSDIETIKNKMEEIINKYTKDTTDKVTIIKTIHDYIINNTKYDSDRSDKKIVNYKSDIAYGPLIQGYGLCGGYTDAMALFLTYYDIPNFKITSENHIWNAVYIDNTWYHLDLTWDDPVSDNGKDILEYTFFLITNDELKEVEQEQHIFDTNVYSEIA